MVNEFAAVGSSNALLHLGEKEFVVIHEALYRFFDQCLLVTAAVSGNTSQLGFELWASQVSSVGRLPLESSGAAAKLTPPR
jgi:hypothetical protein